MDKKLLKAFKVQKTKLLNKIVDTEEEFLEVQDKLNYIEFKIKKLEKVGE